MAKGFVCPKCSNPDVSVVETRRIEGGAILRRRKCYHCHSTFKTFEIMANMIPSEPEFDFLFRKASAQ